MSRSCDELGLCQRRKPRCAGCTAEPLRLAPGVLDAYRVPVFGNAAQRRELVTMLKRAGIWLVLVGVAFAGAGYMAGLMP